MSRIEEKRRKYLRIIIKTEKTYRSLKFYIKNSKSQQFRAIAHTSEANFLIDGVETRTTHLLNKDRQQLKIVLFSLFLISNYINLFKIFCHSQNNHKTKREI